MFEILRDVDGCPVSMSVEEEKIPIFIFGLFWFKSFLIINFVFLVIFLFTGKRSVISPCLRVQSRHV